MEVEVAGFRFDGGESMSQHFADAASFESTAQNIISSKREKADKLPLPINADRCALLAEHRGQERNGEIPQLTNAKVHRHCITLGIHATPSIKTSPGDSCGERAGNPGV